MEGAFDGLNAGEDDGGVVLGGGIDAPHVNGEAVEDPVFVDVGVLLEFLLGFLCDILVSFGAEFELFGLRSSGQSDVAAILVDTVYSIGKNITLVIFGQIFFCRGGEEFSTLLLFAVYGRVDVSICRRSRITTNMMFVFTVKIWIFVFDEQKLFLEIGI